MIFEAVSTGLQAAVGQLLSGDAQLQPSVTGVTAEAVWTHGRGERSRDKRRSGSHSLKALGTQGPGLVNRGLVPMHGKYFCCNLLHIALPSK